MLIARAEVEGRLRDVRLAGGRVAAIAPRLAPAPGEREIDARGGALLPGLHDHHLHLMALAAARASLRCGPPEVEDAPALAAALAAAPRRKGWIRGVAYHESVAGPLDRVRIDALAPAGAMVRIQHRTGACWMLGSAAVEALGLDRGVDAPGVERDAAGHATGRLFRLDAWLRERIAASPGFRVAGREAPPDPAPPDLAPVGLELARYGVTGVTDATVTNDARSAAHIAAARAGGALPQHVVLMNAGPPPAPAKIVLDERAPADPDALAARVAAAHAGGRPVAVHCVTRLELALALAALEEAGPRRGDRIEHASVAPPELTVAMARLGVTVVTQPHFLRERGDAYLAEVEPRDRPWLYRAAGLLAAGVPLGGGSDAPFGAPDPWRAMRAAVERTSRGGRVLAADEALSPERALALFTTPPGAPGGTPRRVAPGVRADLCLLDLPWAEARRDPSAERVAATWIEGALVGAPRGSGVDPLPDLRAGIPRPGVGTA